jgi:predicted phosphodiesterase
MKIVVIGDMHAHPDYDLARFEEAGRFCAEEQPDAIVQIGDWADMCSINMHGSRLELESRRYSEDIGIANESLAVFHEPIARRKRKKPRLIFTEGNHEWFISKLVHQTPQLKGTIDRRHIEFERYGWETYEYRREVQLAGFRFVHNLGSQTGRAARVDSPSNGVKALGVSTVVGHSHSFRQIPLSFKDRRVWGIDVGCLIHKDMGPQQHWSCDTAYKYWRGLWVFDNAANGDADFRCIRAETLGV